MKARAADADSKSGERTEQVDGYTWRYRVENGGATIVTARGERRCSISPSPKGSVAIPSELGGVSVTSIGYGAFAWCSGLTSVTIPSDVTSIGNYAFYRCSELTSVTIPSSVASIGTGAFCACIELSSVRMPSGVKKIGKSAFSSCKKMTSVVMCGEQPEIGEKAFDHCDSLKAIHVPANAKSWEGMKEWQGIPLVFDAESKK